MMTWMSILWGTIILLVIWAFLLFIKDIQRELRWGKVIIVMVIILFGISCLVHRNHLIQLNESKRHSYLMQKNLKDECRKEMSVWSKIVGVFGSGENQCDEYYRNVMIEAGDEISPAVVISETLSKFALHPLPHLGANIGHFFSEFYGNVPVYLQIHASIMLLFVFIMILFVFIIIIPCLFGYEIYLPLWLGSMRPATKSNFQLEEVRCLIQQSEDKINSNNEIKNKIQIMMNISNATLSAMKRSLSDQVPVLQTGFQSVLQNSMQQNGKWLKHSILSGMSSIRQKVLPLDKCEANQGNSELRQNNSDQLDRPSCSKQQTDGKDNVHGNICEPSSNLNFLCKVKEVLGLPLNQSESLSPSSEDYLISEGSFLKRVQSLVGW